MTVYRAYRQSDGIPGLRFFYPRVPSLWNALNRADADIYYVRGAGYLVAMIALFAKSRGRKCVFAAASDSNVDPDIPKLRSHRDRWLYRYGVGAVDAIVVQSLHQSELLKKHFNRSGYVVRNAWGRPSVNTMEKSRDIVLWVGTFRALKQPDHFLRLARQLPHLRFVMVGGPHRGKEDLYDSIWREAGQMANLEVLGFRTLDETQAYFKQAKVLVNTSQHEGFPNTFLQAWAEGIPVVSYVDPDGVVKSNSLGTVVADEVELHLAVKRTMEDVRHDARPILDYFLRDHSVEAAMAAYERIFADVGFEPEAE